MKALLDHRPDLPSCLVSVPGRQAYLQRIAPVLLSNVRSALEKGFWDQALTAIHRYLSIRADDAYAHFLQGEVESRLSGHTDQAMACYAKAIDLDSAFAPAYRALGVLHLKAGHLQQARRYFETSLALAPQALENGYIRGYLQLCSN